MQPKQQQKKIRKKMNNEQEKILRVSQVAEMLGLSVSRIYQLTSKKQIPFFKPLPKLVLFKQSEILEWIETHRIEMQ